MRTALLQRKNKSKGGKGNGKGGKDGKQGKGGKGVDTWRERQCYICGDKDHVSPTCYALTTRAKLVRATPTLGQELPKVPVKHRWNAA